MNTRFVLLAALAACQNPSPLGATAPVPTRPDLQIGGAVVPRIYEIPPGTGPALRRLFHQNGAMSYPIAVVGSGGVQTQFVQIQPAFLGDARVVINAPIQYQPEIEKIIGSLQATKPVTPTTWQVTYWVVQADSASDTAVDADLGDVEATLRGLGGIGKRHFKMLDRLDSRVLDGDKVEAAGRVIEVNESLSSTEAGLELQVTHLKLNGVWKDQAAPYLETRVQIRPDKPLVIGDVSQPNDTGSSLLLYVVLARHSDQ